jgi:hypothetical protein
MKAMKMQGIRQGTRTGNAVDFWRKKGFQGSRSQLQSWASINGSQSSVTFPILATQPNNVNTIWNMEKRLNISDSFIVLSIGVYLGQSPTTGTATPTAAQNAQTQLYTYRNTQQFIAAVDSVYNGYLSIKIGNVNWFPAISLRKFYRVPQAQQVAAGTNQNGIGKDEWETDYGLMKLTPTLTLNGNGNNDFTVTLPDGSTSLIAASGTYNSLVLFLDGIILPNAAGKIDLETSNAFASQFGR